MTNSGNWEEARCLKEKSKNPNIKKSLKNIWSGILVVTIMLATTFWLLARVNARTIGIIGMIGTLYTAYKFYGKMSPEFGETFYIPLRKITGLDIDNKKHTIEILFLNAENERDQKKLTGVGEEGLSLLLRNEKLRALIDRVQQ